MWTEVGTAKVAPLSIFDVTAQQVGPVGVIYTDPPWGEGATKLFDTLRQRQGQKREGAPWEAVIERLVAVSKSVNARLLMVEMGAKWATVTAGMLAAGGYGAHTIYPITATTGGKVREAALIVAERQRTVGHLPVANLRGQELITAALKQTVKAGETVWDPFCGFCNTGLVCQKLGIRFIGTEYNQSRLNKGIARLRAGR